MLVNNLWEFVCDSPRNTKKNEKVKKDSKMVSTNTSKESSPIPATQSQPSTEIGPLTTTPMRLILRKKTSPESVTPDQLLHRVDNHLDKEYSNIGVRMVRALLEQAANDPHLPCPVKIQLAKEYMPDTFSYDEALFLVKEYFEKVGGSKLANYNRVLGYRNDLRTVKIKMTESKMHSQLIDVERKVSLIDSIPEPSAAEMKSSASSPEFYHESVSSGHLVCG